MVKRKTVDLMSNRLLSWRSTCCCWKDAVATFNVKMWKQDFFEFENYLPIYFLIKNWFKLFIIQKLLEFFFLVFGERTALFFPFTMEGNFAQRTRIVNPKIYFFLFLHEMTSIGLTIQIANPKKKQIFLKTENGIQFFSRYKKYSGF